VVVSRIAFSKPREVTAPTAGGASGLQAFEGRDSRRLNYVGAARRLSPHARAIGDVFRETHAPPSSGEPPPLALAPQSPRKWQALKRRPAVGMRGS
jgi:hypothetical protein